MTPAHRMITIGLAVAASLALPATASAKDTHPVPACDKAAAPGRSSVLDHNPHCTPNPEHCLPKSGHGDDGDHHGRSARRNRLRLARDRHDGDDRDQDCTVTPPPPPPPPPPPCDPAQPSDISAVSQAAPYTVTKTGATSLAVAKPDGGLNPATELDITVGGTGYGFTKGAVVPWFQLPWSDTLVEVQNWSFFDGQAISSIQFYEYPAPGPLFGGWTQLASPIVMGTPTSTSCP